MVSFTTRLKRSVLKLQTTLLSSKKERGGEGAGKMRSLKVLWRSGRTGIRCLPLATCCRVFSHVPNPVADNDFDSEVSSHKSFFFPAHSQSYCDHDHFSGCIRCWLKDQVVAGLQFWTDPMFSMLSIPQWCACYPFKPYGILFWFFRRTILGKVNLLFRILFWFFTRTILGRVYAFWPFFHAYCKYYCYLRFFRIHIDFFFSFNHSTSENMILFGERFCSKHYWK